MPSQSQRRPTVWVVYNDPNRIIDDANRFVDPKYLFSGRVLYDRAVEHSRKMMAGYRPGDYVLMVGDPTLCFVVGKVAAELADAAGDERVRVLRWSKYDAQYQEYEFDFNEPEPDVGEAEVIRRRMR